MAKLGAQSLKHPKYVPLSNIELNKIGREKRALVDTCYQIEYNYSTVTIFKDGTATLFPGGGMGEGLLFYDLVEMNKMIGSRVFPVKGDGSFWESEKDRIASLDRNVDYYVAHISSFFNFDFKLSLDSEYLKEASELINKKFYGKKVAPEEYYYLAIYFSELVRRKYNARWMLFVQPTLNLYYIPEVVVDGKYANPIYMIVNALNNIHIDRIDLSKLLSEIDFVPYTTRRYRELH